MSGVVAALPAENQRAGQLRMPELAMRTPAAGHEDKPCMLQIGDQLANLARHTAKPATAPARLPISTPRMRDITTLRLALVKMSGIGIF